MRPRQHISLTIGDEERDAIARRFWAAVPLRGEGCWEFRGSGDWYRSFFVRMDNGKQVVRKAHQVAYALERGPLTGEILHSCDNKKCVRPSHLEVGTHKKNMEDKILRGRQTRGVGHGPSKLNDEKVVVVRKLLAAGCSQKDAADLIGVTQTAIWKIANGETWTHVQ